MEKRQIEVHLAQAGWERNSKGNYTKALAVNAGAYGTALRPCRVRFNKASITVEIHSSTGSGWFRIAGASFDACKQLPDGRLQVISFFIPGATK